MNYRSVLVIILFLTFISSVSFAEERIPCGEYRSTETQYDKLIFEDNNVVRIFSNKYQGKFKFFIQDGYIVLTNGFILKFVKNNNLLGVNENSHFASYQFNNSNGYICTNYSVNPNERLYLDALTSIVPDAKKLLLAKELLFKACQNGHAESCNYYAILQRNYYGDMDQAKQYSKKSCDLGFGSGCHNMAYFVKYDGHIMEAKKLYSKGCELGSIDSCMEMDILNKPSDIRIVEYGIYKDVVRIGKQKTTLDSSNEVSVVDAYHDPVLKKRISKIKGKLGVHFGIQFKATRGFTGAIRPVLIRVVHPPIHSDGEVKARTIDQWNMEAQVDIPRYTGWAFEKECEVVPGIWRIEIIQDDRLITSKTFKIRK